MNESTPSPLGNVITIDDERIKNHLDRRRQTTPVIPGAVGDACPRCGERTQVHEHVKITRKHRQQLGTIVSGSHV